LITILVGVHLPIHLGIADLKFMKYDSTRIFSHPGIRWSSSEDETLARAEEWKSMVLGSQDISGRRRTSPLASWAVPKLRAELSGLRNSWGPRGSELRWQ